MIRQVLIPDGLNNTRYFFPDVFLTFYKYRGAVCTIIIPATERFQWVMDLPSSFCRSRVQSSVKEVSIQTFPDLRNILISNPVTDLNSSFSDRIVFDPERQMSDAVGPNNA
jgi:hypothetical protein